MAIDLSAARLARGAAAGLVASVVMGMYAMITSVYNDTGFFTPLYHIASSIGSPKAMMDSMMAAETGDSLHFVASSALLGAAIHMMVGIMAGVVFVLLLSLRPLSRMVTVAAGIVYGLLVMAANSLVLLPATAATFDSGDPVAHMGKVAGWTTFTVEHVIYGLVLALLVAMTARSRTSRTEVDSSRRSAA